MKTGLSEFFVFLVDGFHLFFQLLALSGALRFRSCALKGNTAGVEILFINFPDTRTDLLHDLQKLFGLVPEINVQLILTDLVERSVVFQRDGRRSLK